MYYWLFEVGIGGRIYRFSTDELEVQLGSATIVYNAGLSDVDINESSLLALDTVNFGVEVTNGEIDLADFDSKGIPIVGSKCFLKRYNDESQYNGLEVYFWGTVSDVKYGAVGEPINFNLRRELGDFSRTILNKNAVINSQTWPIDTSTSVTKYVDGVLIEDTEITTSKTWGLLAASIGKPYPIVIGYPGWDEKTNRVYPVVPVFQCDYMTLETTEIAPTQVITSTNGIEYSSTFNTTTTETEIIPGRIAWFGTTEIDLSRVFVSQEDSFVDVRSCLAVNGVDKLGNKLIMAQNPFKSEPTNEMLIGFFGGSGGGISKLKGGVLRGLGNLVYLFLNKFFFGLVDWPKVNAIVSDLNRFRIDTYINDSEADVISYLSRLLEIFGYGLANGVNGIYVLPVFDIKYYNNDPSLVIAKLNADDSDIKRLGQVAKSSSKDIINQVYVKYAPVIANGSSGYLKTIVVGGDSVTMESGQIVNSSNDGTQNQWLESTQNTLDGSLPPLIAGWDNYNSLSPEFTKSQFASFSQRKYGLKSTTIELDCVWDDETAERLGSETIINSFDVKTFVRYSANENSVRNVKLGSVVSITDIELSFTDKIGVVSDITRGSDGLVELDITFRENII